MRSFSRRKWWIIAVIDTVLNSVTSTPPAKSVAVTAAPATAIISTKTNAITSHSATTNTAAAAVSRANIASIRRSMSVFMPEPAGNVLLRRRPLGQPQRDELRRMVLSADRHDDVLAAPEQVGHRGPGRSGGQFGLPHDFSRGLVVGAELVAERIFRDAGNGVAALADEQQRFGDQRRRPAGGAERRQVQALERRVIA